MVNITSSKAKLPLADQEAIINYYLSNTKKDSTRRVLRALLDKKVFWYSLPIIVNKVTEPSLNGAAFGAACGGMIAGPPGAIKGALLGASLFGGTALYCHFENVAASVERSDSFKVWLGDNIKKDVFPMFLDFIENDEDMQDLKCVLLQDYPSNPVSLPSPDQHVYEKKLIVQWLHECQKKRETNPQSTGHHASPFRIGSPDCKESDLLERSDYFHSTVQKMKKIRDKVIGKMPKEDIRRQGLEAIYHDLCLDGISVLQAQSQQTLSLALHGQVDVKVVKDQLNRNHAILQTIFEALEN